MIDAEFCRAQALEHQARAAAARLPNVRNVALAAAAVWLKEAEHAERVAARRATMQVQPIAAPDL